MPRILAPSFALSISFDKLFRSSCVCSGGRQGVAGKKPVTPTMDIYLTGEAKTDQNKTIQIARNILQTTVNDLIVEASTDYKTKITLTSM